LDAIILAGGIGSRLRADISLPKPLVPVRGKQSLLSFQVNWAKRQGFSNIIVAANIELFKEYRDLIPRDCYYSWEKERLGTGGALKQAMRQVSSPFYVFNVDDVLLEKERPSKSWIRTLRQGLSNSWIYGVIVTGHPPLPFSIIQKRGDQILNFTRNPTLKEVEISIGHYLFTRNIEPYLPDKGDFENYALPKMAREGHLKAVRFPGEWITVNDVKQYKILLEKLEELR